ncbi:class I SAM-dependent methyltransferase [Sphingorhabdus sp. Alg239-R122]|uniref:class I SAM-dependent methyltransferase n=1 Tax=Sphingorhabdus sp. Alg239-R122 TaxID=2305989 RepID=UPI001F082294|nr:class I SAM-dependent methyltransferase [Sphingorhabdus sp. Alg239-R122]
MDISQPSFWGRHIMPRLICYACGQPQIMKRRAQIVPKASGKILELGAGGGINLQFYDPQKVDHVTGIDPSTELINRARQTATRSQTPFDIVGGVAEDMPFEEDSFDTVLITFTLCTVTNQAQSLREVRRVLKPGGKLLYLEHGRAPDDAVHIWQQRVEPMWKRMAGGCHLTRGISSAIENAGFSTTATTGEYMPKTPRILGWIESGEASIVQ